MRRKAKRKKKTPRAKDRVLHVTQLTHTSVVGRQKQKRQIFVISFMWPETALNVFHFFSTFLPSSIFTPPRDHLLQLFAYSNFSAVFFIIFMEIKVEEMENYE